MTYQPRVSVVVPCYNGQAFLREALQSALHQTHAPLEAIVIDDGSTDDSARIAASFGPLVRLIRQKNQGESVARNRGMDEARGDWIAFLDADDRWAPNRLELIASSSALEDPSVVCVFNNHYVFFADGTQVDTVPDRAFPKHNALNQDLAFMISRGGILPSCAVVRADVAKEVCFNPNIRANEDLLYFLDLRCRGNFYRLPKNLTGWRRSPHQQTRNPSHRLHGTIHRLDWLNAHRHMFNANEYENIVCDLAKRLVSAHDKAYWARDWVTVKSCRSAARSLFDLPPATFPPHFHRRLPPRFLARVKDMVDNLCGRRSKTNET